jgi:O-6-methylguanine DNA methyltransferase
VHLRLVVATRLPGPLHDLTAERPGLTVEAWPVGQALLLRCEGDVRGLDEPARWEVPGRRLVHAHREGKGRASVLLEGPGEDAPLAVLLAEGVHLVPPVAWAGGEARVTLLAPEDADVERVRALFPEGRVVAKGPMDGRPGRTLIASPLLLPGLTRKQAGALLAAYEAGYYAFPRAATTGDVAAKVGVARSTLEQHLNRAESQVLGALLPVVRLRARGGDATPAEDAEAVERFSRFSQELGLFVTMELRADRVRRVALSREAPPVVDGDDHPHLRRVLDHLRTGREDLSDVPVDLDRGGFEREVLDLLRAIPPGQTLSYGEIARRLGKPRAGRAVGNACARNPALVVIPCHRVVRAGGDFGHYAGEGGQETKRRLLEREAAGAGTTRDEA